MQVSLYCVGRMKSGPERQLFERYFERAEKTGKQIGLTGFNCLEIPESRGEAAERRKVEEGDRLRGFIAEPRTALILFDETGRSPTSRAFADLVGDYRDAGIQTLGIGIGGPDGHDPALLARADAVISFGKMTMPHQIARILVAEQLYRATSILTGHPYHRD